MLGVLPGTGGLTRVVDKRKVRRDLADMFCTNPDGVKGERAKEWGLVDEVVAPAKFQEVVRARAEKLAQTSTRSADAKGIKLTQLDRTIDDSGYHYKYVDVTFDRARADGDSDGASSRRRSAADRSTRFTRPATSGGRCRWRASWTMPS